MDTCFENLNCCDRVVQNAEIVKEEHIWSNECYFEQKVMVFLYSVVDVSILV